MHASIDSHPRWMRYIHSAPVEVCDVKKARHATALKVRWISTIHSSMRLCGEARPTTLLKNLRSTAAVKNVFPASNDMSFSVFDKIQT